MKAAVYLRVSKTICICGHEVRSHESETGPCKYLGQKCACAACTPRQSEANQEPDCLRICASRGWEPIFFREHESAVKWRPRWEEVKTAVHRGEVGAVVFWALDRVSRDRVRLAHDLAELARKGATLVSAKESWLDQPVGQMRDFLIQVMGWFAETERARLIERTLAGQERARAMGKRIGRPELPPDLVRLARGEFERGRSAFLAAKQTGIPESTLRAYWRRWGGFNPYPRKVGRVSG